MNRTFKDSRKKPISRLMETLAITGFAAEVNLRDVARALAQKEFAVFEKAPERNSKLARLRIEIDEQVAIEMAKVTVGNRERKRLNLTSDVARMFENFGAHTVPIARLCSELLRQSKPSRVTEIKKFIEHVVYISDKAVPALIDEDLSRAKAAIEQSLAAKELYNRIKGELSTLAGSSPADLGRLDLLNRIADETNQILELVSGTAQAVVTFLEGAEL